MKTLVSKNLIYFILIVIVSACNSSFHNVGETLTVDLSDRDYISSKLPSDVPESLKVAVSAMTSPKETFIFYEELFKYISEKTASRITFRQRKTYQEVNNMLENHDVDLAFICSGAYALGNSEKMEILAIPVSNGKNHYQAYVVVHVNSAIHEFKELQDKKFAYTDPISHSGKLYADKRMREMGYRSGFFSKTFYSHAHDISMQLVSKRIVDGASIKSSVYDYLEKFEPERVRSLRIIEKSENYGMPPIVVPVSLDEDKKKQLREFFLTLHEDPAGKKILDKLLIDKFIIGHDEDYNSIRDINNMLKQ
jgi:phosphonate transport system substrate-binding protein